MFSPEQEMERYRNRVDSYNTKPQRYKDDPDWFVLEDFNSFNAFKKSSPQGKQYARNLEQIKSDQELAVYTANNPVEIAFDELMDRETVTRIEIRAKLDELCGFTPERLQETAKLLEAEGVEIK